MVNTMAHSVTLVEFAKGELYGIVDEKGVLHIHRYAQPYPIRQNRRRKRIGRVAHTLSRAALLAIIKELGMAPPEARPIRQLVNSIHDHLQECGRLVYLAEALR